MSDTAKIIALARTVVGDLKNEISVLEPAATSEDVGKFLTVKTVSGGKVTEYEFGSGGSSGGTDDYSDLANKPQINGVTLAGNKSASDLGLLAGQDVTEAVDDYLEENFSNPSNPPLDRTLSSALSAAPADMVGDIKKDVSDLQYVLTSLSPFDDSKFSANYANKTTSEYEHDYAATATGYGSATPRLIYTLSDYPSISANDIMYVSAKLYAEASQASDWDKLYRPNIFGQSMGDSSLAYNEWVPYSKRYTQTSNVGKSVTFGYSYNSTSVANGKTVHLRDLVVINLTKTYGSGKEPSLAEMDAIIAENDGYIEKLNLFNSKQITDDVDDLKEDAFILTKNVFLPVVNYGNVRHSGRINDGTEYSSASSAKSVSDEEASSTAVHGDIIYAYGEFKPYSESDNCSALKVIVNNGSPQTMLSEDIENPLNDNWYPMSAYFCYNSSSTGNVARFIAEWEANASIRIYWRNIVCINLTEVFGKNCEPSKELLDRYFEFVSLSGAFDFVSVNTTMFNVGSASNYMLKHPNGMYVKLDQTGNVQMGSIPSPSWEGWQEIGTYGQNNVGAIPIYNKVHGTIETDGMMSVIPIWGCWSDNAASTGNTHHGGHVFHGWTTDRMHRLTMVQNIYRDDEAAVFNYIPGDKSDTSEGIFLRLRLGADNNYKGVLIENEYGGSNNTDYHLARMTVYGRLNITRHNNYNNIPASANAAGTAGDICVDGNYIYVCTATDTWKRVPLQAWE